MEERKHRIINRIRVDSEKLRPDILKDISNNLSHDLETSKQMIKNMTPEEAFDCYCNWHGLINWSGTLIDAFDNIKQAVKEIEKEEPKLSLTVRECKYILDGRILELARINKKLSDFVKENS